MKTPKIDKARIIRLRKERGLSTKEAAQKMGISAPHLSMLETGQAGIGLKALIRFCLFYDVQVTDLLETTESESTQETTKPTNVAA